MTLDTFQLGEPVEHRGIVVTPLFPRQDPVAVYVTLDEALPRGFRIDETSDSGSVPELVVENPHGRAGAALRRRGARRREAEPDPERERARRGQARSCRSPSRASSRAAGTGAARRSVQPDHISHSHLRRRKAQMLAAQPLARGAAQGEVWDEVHAKQTACASTRTRRPAGTRSRRTEPGSARSRARSRSHPDSAAPCSRSATTCASTRSHGPTRSRSSGRSSGAGYLLDALERLDGRATSVERVSSFVDEVAAARATRGPSAGLGEDVRLRGNGVIGSGLELDDETLQLSAFTSDDAGERAFGRIARPSRRR